MNKGGAYGSMDETAIAASTDGVVIGYPTTASRGSSVNSAAGVDWDAEATRTPGDSFAPRGGGEAIIKRTRHKTLDALTRRNLRVLAVIGAIVVATVLVVVVTMLADAPPPPAVGQAFLVESLPVGDFAAIKEIPGVLSSWSTLTGMINNTNSTLDVTVMYWDLLAWNSSDAPYFTPAQFEAFGAGRGQMMFDAFAAAAERGVQIRFVQSYSATQPPYELLNLQSRYPKQISVVYWNADAWFGGGIMHQKLWISDRQSIYIGSANMDWKSLAQVKELGVYVESTALAEDLSNYFDNWVEWSSLPAVGQAPVEDDTGPGSVQAWSATFDCNLTKPCWSKLVPETSSAQCSSPLTRHDSFTFSKPMEITLNGELSEAFISGSPQEVLGEESLSGFCVPKTGDGSWRMNEGAGDGRYLREWDQDSIVKTIYDADSFVGLSVMDFIPTSLYDGGHSTDGQAQPVWWPAFIDPLISAAYARGVTVKLLISKWAHTNSKIAEYLAALNATAAICGEPARYTQPCRGSFEIRLFEVPGWNNTYGSGAAWPSYSRVNHAKYVVTDRRVNIGTSNHAWGYFYNTAGASFNSNNTIVRAQLEQIFLRDWNSPYAVPL